VKGWSEEEFRDRVTARAAELGDTVNALLERAGIMEAFRKTPVSGRRVDTLEKIAEALDWTLPDVMGHVMSIDFDLLLMAYLDAVHLVVPFLPRSVRDDPAIFTRALGLLYEEYVDCVRKGDELDEKYRAACARMLVRLLEGRASEPSKTATARRARNQQKPE
jgi:hypothetical protein